MTSSAAGPVTASVVWVLPIPSSIGRAAAEHPGWRPLDPGTGWDLSAVETSWWRGREPTGAVRSRSSWFVRSRLDRAITHDSEQLLATDPVTLPSVAGTGIAVAAVELRRNLGDDDMDAVCLHLNLSGRARDRVDLVTQLLRRPGRVQPLTGSTDRGGFRADVTNALKTLGVNTPDDRLDLSEGGYLYAGRGSRGDVRPQILSHVLLGPDAGAPPLLQGYRHWHPHQQWAYALASGVNPELYFRLPADQRSEAAASTTWLGHTMVRAERDGLACVSTRDPSDPWVENVDLQLLVHGRFLDLALLAMRQQFFLERHANRLAETAQTWGGADEHDDLGEVIGHEERLLRFRNRLWFTSVPSRHDGTAVLRLLQAGYGSPELLAEVAAEQADMVRILDLRDNRLRRQLADRTEQTRAEQAEQARQQQEQQERTRRTIELGVAVLTPPAVLGGLLALFDEPSPALFAVTVGLSLAIIAVAVLVLRATSPQRPTQT